jgi:hypothetical protein
MGRVPLSTEGTTAARPTTSAWLVTPAESVRGPQRTVTTEDGPGPGDAPALAQVRDWAGDNSSSLRGRRREAPSGWTAPPIHPSAPLTCPSFSRSRNVRFRPPAILPQAPNRCISVPFLPLEVGCRLRGDTRRQASRGYPVAARTPGTTPKGHHRDESGGNRRARLVSKSMRCELPAPGPTASVREATPPPSQHLPRRLAAARARS